MLLSARCCRDDVFAYPDMQNHFFRVLYCVVKEPNSKTMGSEGFIGQVQLKGHGGPAGFGDLTSGTAKMSNAIVTMLHARILR